MEPDPRGERQGNWNTEYGLLFEHSRDGILFTAPDGRIFDANPAACRALGRTVAELRALGRDGVIDLTDPRLPAAIAARTQGGHWVGELTFIRRDGTKFPVQLSSTLFPDHDGRPRASIIFRDVTAILEAARERSLLEAQLLQAQKMESLGILAGGMAHDMNNVLTAILGMAQASLGDHPAGSPAYAAFDTIAQAALRGGRTVRGILSFARGTAVEDRELDLNDVVREEARILERTTLEGVRVALELAPDLRPMRGDASALTHAIMNLCVNAVDAMPANGTLTLRTRNLDPGWIEVTVQDTGTGMPGDVIARALDPFFTTKEVGKGTGLGLAIVYRTVTAHNGRMEIQSEPGQGTRIMLRFPACVPGARIQAPSDGRQATPPGHPGLSVLVVDDDELVQRTMTALLGTLGHRAVVVPSGEAALARLEAGFRPDVVILDLNMPGLGGAGTLPRLRTLRPALPVLLATGRVDQGVRMIN